MFFWTCLFLPRVALWTNLSLPLSALCNLTRLSGARWRACLFRFKMPYSALIFHAPRRVQGFRTITQLLAYVPNGIRNDGKFEKSAFLFLFVQYRSRLLSNACVLFSLFYHLSYIVAYSLHMSPLHVSYFRCKTSSWTNKKSTHD
jgi:hypothetical protein